MYVSVGFNTSTSGLWSLFNKKKIPGQVKSHFKYLMLCANCYVKMGSVVLVGCLSLPSFTVSGVLYVFSFKLQISSSSNVLIRAIADSCSAHGSHSDTYQTDGVMFSTIAQ